jgi:hypothetical protein
MMYTDADRHQPAVGSFLRGSPAFAGRLWTTFLVGALATLLALGAFAQDTRADDGDEIPFDEAEIFFELNDTDGDLGIHALIDGEPWKSLEIEGPRGRTMLDVEVKGRLRRQGLTEIFFESAEPPFESEDADEVTLTPEEFFDRFREGAYEIEGETLEGEELESEAEVTHLVPAPPLPSVNGISAPADRDEGPIPVVSGSVTITWPAVTMSHPELGRTNEPIKVVNYEVVVEIEDTRFKTSTILPPDQTSLKLPPEILALSDEFKFEVLVRETSFNQTAVESCFALAG